ncbi:hypothetical protein BD309DRAFT_1072370 [Dichomitus squalens]|nr:hypothetical protein BD309DRAFT_1072370 [Dichomitus squalens]
MDLLRSCSCRRALPQTHKTRLQLFTPSLSARKPPLRQASTSANPYPFPRTAHPTPHQIFHLPRSATQADVKARYYDLVRIYHPDSPAARAGGISPETAHARFQAISSAYAILTGKKSGSLTEGGETGDGLGGKARASYHDLSTAMWRERQRRKADLDVGFDDRWKDRLMLGAVLLVRSLRKCMIKRRALTARTKTIGMFVYQTYTTRAKALSESRQTRRSSTRAGSASSTEPAQDPNELQLVWKPPSEASDQRSPS